MISSVGKNLSVIILSQTSMDWQAFATWYSLYKNLPEASVMIVNQRNKDVPFLYYQWTKRLKIPTLHINQLSEDDILNKLHVLSYCKDISKQTILIEPYTIIGDAIDEQLLTKFNTKNIIVDDQIWFVNSQNISELITDYQLSDVNVLSDNKDKICFEAKNTDLASTFISYKKGCGKWIHTAKGCPFSSAGGLINNEMTINEKRVIEMWKKMVPLYNAVV